MPKKRKRYDPQSEMSGTSKKVPGTEGKMVYDPNPLIKKKKKLATKVAKKRTLFGKDSPKLYGVEGGGVKIKKKKKKKKKIGDYASDFLEGFMAGPKAIAAALAPEPSLADKITKKKKLITKAQRKEAQAAAKKRTRSQVPPGNR